MPIPDLFKAKPARNEISTGAEWVENGEGVATQMLDGVGFEIRDGNVVFEPGTDKTAIHAIEVLAVNLPDGAYEAMGPSFGGNNHQFGKDVAYNFSDLTIDAPRDYDGLANFFKKNAMEGIVWHHQDGRMVKVKSADLGVPWPPEVKTLG